MAQDYKRDPGGQRLDFIGINIVLPPDMMPPGKFPFAQNVRRYLRGRIIGRATEDSSILPTFPSTPHSIRRLNDSTPAGPAIGYIYVVGAGTNLYANSTQVDSGFSGNPISLLPFRPNTSVQPWMYVGDSVKMDKVRSDGTRFKTGIAEPQASPTISSTPASLALSLIGNVTVEYWGDSPHSGPVAEYIWKNSTDHAGSGPVRTAQSPNGTTTGNSLLFDVGAVGNQQTPMQWVQFVVNNGTVNTSGTAVTWVSGDDFGDLQANQNITIGTTHYLIASVTDSTHLVLQSSAGTQTGVDYSAVATSGSVAVFQPALESEGYSDFNFCLSATLYVPAAGTYTLNLDAKDDAIWGIGGSGNGQATWAPPPTGGNALSEVGQTKTVLNGYPLLPRTSTNDGAGQTTTASVAVTFSAPGNYPLEIDYDFWYHSGRTLTVKNGAIDIQPIPNTNITEAQYRYTYRSSATGAQSNGSPPSQPTAISSIANTITPTPSSDPQVDKIDFYRLDTGLENYTYVGTGPNSATAFTDSLTDQDVSANPILEFDNFEPFPSIDLPRSGVVNVSGGVATWVSGDKFNTRWLPGTIILVGPVGSQVAYTFDKRPTDATHLTATNVVEQGGIPVTIPITDGTNQPYNIAEPILAAQPLAYLWGPTDNVAFFFGVGDPLRPGTLYWSKGNNPDSAPDTNQMDVTSPSEPLINGCTVNGIGWVASAERAWLIYPNFFNALATVNGTEGATWTLQESDLKRGLYMPRCLTVDGGGNVYFRAKDGIYVSPGGTGGRSITDEDLFNLFPHEGEVPSAVTRGGYTIYPPDDTKPQAQRLNAVMGYVYYDYIGTDGIQHTLVFDIAANGWVWDSYEFPPAVHVLQEGPNVNGVIVGCTDGTVRPLIDSGSAENLSQSIVLTPSYTAGDVRAQKHWGDLYIEAGIRGGV